MIDNPLWDLLTQIVLPMAAFGVGWWGGRRGSVRVALKRHKVQITGRLMGRGRVCPICHKEAEILALDDGSFTCEPCLKAKRK